MPGMCLYRAPTARGNFVVSRCCLRRECWILGARVRTDQRSRSALVGYHARWFQAEWALDCVVFTISQQEIRQAALFEAAGLEQRSACTLWDGRLCWVFG